MPGRSLPGMRSRSGRAPVTIGACRTGACRPGQSRRCGCRCRPTARGCCAAVRCRGADSPRPSGPVPARRSRPTAECSWTAACDDQVDIAHGVAAPPQAAGSLGLGHARFRQEARKPRLSHLEGHREPEAPVRRLASKRLADALLGLGAEAGPLPRRPSARERCTSSNVRMPSACCSARARPGPMPGMCSSSTTPGGTCARSCASRAQLPVFTMSVILAARSAPMSGSASRSSPCATMPCTLRPRSPSMRAALR